MSQWSLPILLLTGCGTLSAYDVAADPAGDGGGDLTPVGDGGGDADGDVDADADTDADTDADLAIDEVVPPYGIDAGGDNVEIFGGPFDPPVTVTFDGVEAEVLSSDDGRISILTPPGVESEDYADVEVTTPNGSATARDAFVYWADGTGLYGAWGSVEWNELKGGYWDPASVSSGLVQILFPVPTPLSWPEFLYAATLDSCELEYVAGNQYVYDPAVDPLTLTSGSTTVDVSWDATYYSFVEFSLPQSKIENGQDYDLEPVGSFGWPEDPIAAFTGVVPTAMNVTTPDIDQPAPPATNRNFSLQWSGPYSGDYVLVWMQRQRWNGAAFVPQENATCWLADDGTFLVDGNSLWTAWDTTDDYVYLAVGRTNEPVGVTLDHNHATSGVVGTYWVTGFLDAD